MNKLVTYGAIAGALIIAFATNPNVADHQREFNAIQSQRLGNAISSLNLNNISSNLKSSLLGTTEYRNFGVASIYTVTVDGQQAVRCLGIFGKVTCQPVATT